MINYELSETLNARKEQQLLRTLRPITPAGGTNVCIAGRTLINFSSNDYLGLSQHPFLKETAIQYVERYGVGFGSSRLVSGNYEIFESIEQKLAQLKGTQSALLFSTGYQLNLTVLHALSKLGARFICDRLCHNSLLSGATLNKANFARYKHNDLADLQTKLDSKDWDHCSPWIISQSVFGMDGDLADIPGLNSVANKSNCALFIDEAHATGVFGDNGMGLATGLTVPSIIMGTFGKGLGSFGAYIACSSELREYLVNFCPGFIYTTALPPSVLGAIDAALQIVPTLKKERTHLHALSSYTRNRLKDLGYDIGTSASHIIPVIVHDDGAAVSLAQYLEDAGIFAAAIRPPTVPSGTARLRISLSALHNETHVDRLIEALRGWRSADAQSYRAQKP